MLAILAASDARLTLRGGSDAVRLPWKPVFSRAGVAATLGCLALASFIAQQAWACESLLLRAVRMAQTLTLIGERDPSTLPSQRAEVLRLTKEGIHINSHYRKIIFPIGVELSKWGDNKNLAWVLEGLLATRPYIPTLMANLSKVHQNLGNSVKAQEMFDRVKKIRPNSPAVHALEVHLLAANGKEPQALTLVHQHLLAGSFDAEMLNMGFGLAMQAKDWNFAIRAMELRNQKWPETKADGEAKMGNAWLNKGDNQKALEHFRAALTGPLQALPKFDIDTLYNSFVLAMQAKDWDFAIRAMEVSNQNWPETKADGEAKLGNAWLAKGYSQKALEHFRAAMAATPPAQHPTTLKGIPQNLWPQLQQ